MPSEWTYLTIAGQRQLVNLATASRIRPDSCEGAWVDFPNEAVCVAESMEQIADMIVTSAPKLARVG